MVKAVRGKYITCDMTLKELIEQRAIEEDLFICEITNRSLLLKDTVSVIETVEKIHKNITKIE